MNGGMNINIISGSSTRLTQCSRSPGQKAKGRDSVKVGATGTKTVRSKKPQEPENAEPAKVYLILCTFHSWPTFFVAYTLIDVSYYVQRDRRSAEIALLADLNLHQPESDRLSSQLAKGVWLLFCVLLTFVAVDDLCVTLHWTFRHFVVEARCEGLLIWLGSFFFWLRALQLLFLMSLVIAWNPAGCVRWTGGNIARLIGSLLDSIVCFCLLDRCKYRRLWRWRILQNLFVWCLRECMIILPCWNNHNLHDLLLPLYTLLCIHILRKFPSFWADCASDAWEAGLKIRIFKYGANFISWCYPWTRIT